MCFVSSDSVADIRAAGIPYINLYVLHSSVIYTDGGKLNCARGCCLCMTVQRVVVGKIGYVDSDASNVCMYS